MRDLPDEVGTILRAAQRVKARRGLAGACGMLSFRPMLNRTTGRAAVLNAFDRLFARAVSKLHLDCTEDDRARAREDFVARYDQALRVVDEADLPEVPELVMAHLEAAIDNLSPAAVAAHLAVVPLAVHVQECMQRIAAKAAERKVIEQLAAHADDRFGGH